VVEPGQLFVHLIEQSYGQAGTCLAVLSKLMIRQAGPAAKPASGS
jgi:hypothetical protein